MSYANTSSLATDVMTTSPISLSEFVIPPPYSIQKFPFLIRIVGTVVDRSLSTLANSLMSPAVDGEDVLTRVTVPLVKT